MDFINIIATMLALINIFQLLDRRSRSNYLENTIGAAHAMSARMMTTSSDPYIKREAADLCSVLEGTVHAVRGSKIPIAFIHKLAKGKEVKR